MQKRHFLATNATSESCSLISMTPTANGKIKSMLPPLNPNSRSLSNLHANSASLSPLKARSKAHKQLLPEINVNDVEDAGSKAYMGSYKSIPALHPTLYKYIKTLESDNSTLKEQLGHTTGMLTP